MEIPERCFVRNLQMSAPVKIHNVVGTTVMCNPLRMEGKTDRSREDTGQYGLFFY